MNFALLFRIVNEAQNESESPINFPTNLIPNHKNLDQNSARLLLSMNALVHPIANVFSDQLTINSLILWGLLFSLI